MVNTSPSQGDIQGFKSLMSHHIFLKPKARTNVCFYLIVTLDLSNFDTSKVNNTKEMFYRSLNFEKIYVNGYGTHTLRIKNTTIDKIYLLSAREVWKDTSAEENLLDFDNSYGTSAGRWWLRSTSGETSEARI